MSDDSLKRIAEMLVILAGCEEDAQLDVLACVARVWCEKHSRWLQAEGSVRLWARAQKAAARES